MLHRIVLIPLLQQLFKYTKEPKLGSPLASSLVSFTSRAWFLLQDYPTTVASFLPYVLPQKHRNDRTVSKIHLTVYRTESQRVFVCGISFSVICIQIILLQDTYLICILLSFTLFLYFSNPAPFLSQMLFSVSLNLTTTLQCTALSQSLLTSMG